MPQQCNSTGMTLAVARPEVRSARHADLPAVAAHMDRMLTRELGGHDPRLHADVDDLAGSYLHQPGRRLLVATVDGTLAGTASVRPGGPRPEFVPSWLSARYTGRCVGQICRVWVDPGHRRLGVGGLLATAAARWAADEGDTS